MEKDYNHNHIWARRNDQHPIWGPHAYWQYRICLASFQCLGIRSGDILDFGCGAGAFGREALRHGFGYCGLDESEQAIAMGKRAFSELDLHHWDLVTNAPDFLVDREFAAGVSLNVLHCLVRDVDRQQFLKHFFDALSGTKTAIFTGMSAPVLAGHRETDAPRIYKESGDLIAELHAAGWSHAERLIWAPADGITKVSNIVLLARLH